MKHKKQLFITIIILSLLLVGLGTLAATNTTQNNNNIKKNTDIKAADTIKDTTKTPVTETQPKQLQKSMKEKNQKQDSTPVNINDFAQLAEEVATGSGTKILNITQDITLERALELNSSITDLTINGNQKVINGTGHTHLVDIVSGQTVKINDLIVSNCNFTWGGAINNKGNLIITNSNFTYNYATGRGGAICNSGNMTVINSTFMKNQVNVMGDEGFGGAIYNYENGNLTILESSFNYNDDSWQGGAIFVQDGSLTITNSNLTHNYARAAGGALYINNGYINITYCDLSDNTAQFFGGAIYKEACNLNLTLCNLTSNFASSRGGAVYISNPKTLTSINSSYFLKNRSETGGAILSRSNVDIINNTFINNTANPTRDTIDFEGQQVSGLFEGNTYENNDVELSHIDLSVKDYQRFIRTGEDVVLNFTITPRNSRYYNDFEEGLNDIIIYVNGEEYATTRYENYTLSGLEPGEYVVNFTSCRRKSNNVTFTVADNFERNVSNYGELVEAIEDAKSKEYNVYTINLLPGDYNATQNMTWNNSLTWKIVINGNGNILNGNNTYQFINTSAEYNLTIENIVLTNYTSEFGGAINNQGILTIKNSTLKNNSAEFSGGAVFNNGNLTIKDSTLENNKAQWGGAVYGKSEYTNFDAVNSTFTKNNVTREGAAIYSYGYLNATGNTFSYNHAQNKETIDLVKQLTGDFKDNTYEYTDINLTKFSLSIKDQKTPFDYYDNIVFNLSIIPTSHEYYKDFENGINDITLYLNGEKYITTRYENTSVTRLEPGTYTAYFTTCNQQSNNVTFTVDYISKDRRILELEALLNESNNTIKSLNNTVQEQNSTIQQQNRVIEDQNKTIQDQNKTIQDQNKSIAELKDNYNQLEEEINKLKDELDKLNRTTVITAQQNGNTVGNTTVDVNLDNKMGDPIRNATLKAVTPNGTIVGQATTDNNGKATIPINATTTTPISIKYDGNDKYYKSESNLTVTVNKNNVTIKLSPIKGIIGEDITLTARLTDQNGNPVSGGNLAFKLNGKTLRSDGRFDSNASAMKFSVKNGLVTYTIKADLYLRNAKNLTASYSGTSKYQETSSPSVEAQIQKRYANVTVTVTPTLTKQYDTITIKVTAKDTTKNGKNTTLITDNTKVMLKINGVTLKDSKGKTLYISIQKDKTVTYTYNIPGDMGGVTSTGKVRNYPVTAIFVGDNYYPGAKNASNFQVERSNTTVTIQEAKVVTKSNVLSVKATLKDYKGNYLKGTNKVTIKINGKNYVDSNGKAKYWSVKDGVVDLTGIQVDPKTTIKRVMLVTGERQAYTEGRNETTNIIRV